MGYYTDTSIATIKTKPAIIALAGTSNFVEFAGLTDNNQQPLSVTLQVANTDYAYTLDIKELKNNNTYTITATKNTQDISNNAYYVHEDKTITAMNLRNCLLANDFFKSRFKISIPPIVSDGKLVNGDTLHIEALGAGADYAFEFINLNVALTLSGDTTVGTNSNSLSGYEIELDIYTDTALALGTDNLEQAAKLSGNHITTFTKTCIDNSVWFELNSIVNNMNYNIDLDQLCSGNWTNTNTISDFRFTAAKNDGINRQLFYISDVIYSLNGYTRDPLDLNDYIYNAATQNKIKPLSTQPKLHTLRGQTQFFNFILSNPTKLNTQVALSYTLYTASGSLITSTQKHSTVATELNTVNTIKLDFDSLLSQYPNTGTIDVCLTHNDKPVSQAQSYTVLPDYLYSLYDFAFLNSLGGWSSFNFAGTKSVDFKSESTIITKSPGTKHNDLESTLYKTAEEQFSIQTMPIDQTICDWLKELSVSTMVVELSTGKTIIVDDLNIKTNNKDDLFILEMKYHYSNKFNNTAQ